jgi:hypothetical protein
MRRVRIAWRQKKEDIKQPLLPDVFRRGENSFTVQIDKTPINSLGKLQINFVFFVFSALSGKKVRKLSDVAGFVPPQRLTLFKPH